MNNRLYSVITGTGSYIPDRRVPNSDFLNHTFRDSDGTLFKRSNKEVIRKFEEITGIRERRYVGDDLLASDMGAIAAEKALLNAAVCAESLDYIIVAHNFGDVRPDNIKVDMLPSLASRIKQKLGIKNPECIAYDLPFGCPGWLQGIIQSDYYLRSGDAKKALVIGTETLSRVCDPHDRDSMIYADGAGAAVIEGRTGDKATGILSHTTRTDTEHEAFYLTMNRSFRHNCDDTLYLKMEGRKLYQYALTNVPGVVKKCLEKSGLGLHQISKVLIHQANAKMDEAILNRLFKLCDVSMDLDDLMPMTISTLGNSSVATIPTMLDLILSGRMEGHHIHPGDNIVFASVGAGMNINAVVYRV
ncbi:MAG: ketoacyl-ACP synthase III [Balneolaceae bacterium]